MRHWQILKREDGINSKCQNCIHFFSEESGEADCKYDIDPEWDDDESCPYVCDDRWYSHIPSDEQYCDRAERKEE